MTIVSCSATVMFLVSTTSLFTSISVMVVMMSFLCFHEYLSLCLVYITKVSQVKIHKRDLT